MRAILIRLAIFCKVSVGPLIATRTGSPAMIITELKDHVATMTTADPGVVKDTMTETTTQGT